MKKLIALQWLHCILLCNGSTAHFTALHFELHICKKTTKCNNTCQSAPKLLGSGNAILNLINLYHISLSILFNRLITRIIIVKITVSTWITSFLGYLPYRSKNLLYCVPSVMIIVIIRMIWQMTLTECTLTCEHVFHTLFVGSVHCGVKLFLAWVTCTLRKLPKVGLSCIDHVVVMFAEWKSHNMAVMANLNYMTFCWS